MWQSAAIRNRGPPESETTGSFDLWRKGSDREGPSYYCQPARVPYIGGTTRQKAPAPQAEARNGVQLPGRSLRLAKRGNPPNHRTALQTASPDCKVKVT